MIFKSSLGKTFLGSILNEKFDGALEKNQKNCVRFVTVIRDRQLQGWNLQWESEAATSPVAKPPQPLAAASA